MRNYWIKTNSCTIVKGIERNQVKKKEKYNICYYEKKKGDVIMWITETIDLDDHDSIVKFMKKQSNKIKELENENEQFKQLLREVEHELTSLTGLYAFDKYISQLGYVEVFDNDYWELNYSEILKNINKKLKK